MGDLNGYDKESWHVMFNKIQAIDTRTREHEQCFENMKESLGSISKNTGVVAEFFQELREDNRELSRIAAGKNQAPLYLFVIGIVFISIYIIADQVKDSNLNIDIPWIGVHITQADRPHAREERKLIDADKQQD